MEKRSIPVVDDLSQYSGVIVAIFAVILTFVLFIFWQRRKSSGRYVLLTGLSDSGKTLLYARIFHPMFIGTHTSAKENVSEVKIKDRTIRLVDIPGDERLRYAIFDKYKSSMRGLIYVIDSLMVQKDIRDVAEFLYNLLNDPKVQKNTPVLILCNKQDYTLAKGSSVIESALEKELNLVRMTKASQLEATDNSSKSSFFGKKGKDFEFSDLNMKIEFAECTAGRAGSHSSFDIDQLKYWLVKIA